MRLLIILVFFTLSVFSACKSWGKFWTTAIIYPGTPLFLQQNIAMGAVTPSMPGGARSCDASPALPSGLSLAADCTIYGTPTHGQPATTYRIAADIGSDTVYGDVVIRVLFQPRFLYCANSNSSNISLFTIYAGGGLSSATTYGVGATPRFVLIHPTGKYLFNADNGSAGISVMRLSQADGSLAHIPGSPFTTATNPYSLALDPQGRFLYVGHDSTGVAAVSAYTIDITTGTPTQVSGSPFSVASGSSPASVYVDPSGKFLYVGKRQSTTNAHVFAINQATGALTQISGSPFTTINDAISVFVHPSGKYVYYAQYFPPMGIVAFNRDTNSGRLSLMPGSPFPAGLAPGFVTGDVSGKFIYLANSDDAAGTASISAFTVNASGALDTVAGSPFASGMNPIGFAIAETGSFGYAANTVSHTVSAFTIDASSGALSQIAGSPYSGCTAPYSVAVAGSNP